MENYFLSKRNYTLLYEIVKTGLYKRWNYDISVDRENGFLEKMNTIMKQIYADRKKFNIDENAPVADVVKSLNKYTLDFIMPHFGEIIQYSTTVKKSRSELPPQSSMHTPQTFSSHNNHMMERSMSSRAVEKESVMKDYQRLNNERDNALKPHIPKPIDFTLPTGDKSDPSDRFMTMQNQRDNELERFKHVRDATITEKKSTPIPNEKIQITKSGIEGYSNMNAHNLAQDSFNDMNEQKKRIDRSIESSLEELTTQRENLFKQTLDVKNTSFGKKQTMETFLGKGNVIENRNTDIFFNNDNSSVNPNILFQEDKTVKALYEERMSRPEEPRAMAFKPPLETEYRTQYITVDSRDRVQASPNTPSNFVVKFPYIRIKNVKSIKLLSAILPNETSIRNEPYVLVSIPEIDGPMYSSNNRDMKIFTKIYNNKNTHNTALHYLNYMPDPIKKEYPINALGSLEKLTIRLHKHDGSDITMTGGTGGGDDPVDLTSFTFEIVQTVADTKSLQSQII